MLTFQSSLSSESLPSIKPSLGVSVCSHHVPQTKGLSEVKLTQPEGGWCL